jgi:ureidoacrylate peracid hydrolase
MPSYVPEAKTIVPNINRLARAVRASGGLVVWIQTEARPAEDWYNRKESISAAGWARRQAQLGKGSEGFALYPTCEVNAEDKIALKYRYSAFIPYPSELEHALRERGIDTLLVTGTTTSTCCESTARDASMWGYRTIMVSDGTADALDAHHNHTLGKFLVTFGDVQSTDELVARLDKGQGQGATTQPARAAVGAK